MPSQNSFIEYKAIQATLEAKYAEASQAINSIPDISDGIMGLTHDSVKASPEWKSANDDLALAFANLRNFNKWFTSVFAANLRAERKTKRA